VINSLIEDKVTLDYNLIFAATCDEETGSNLGLIPLLDKRILKPDAAVVLDSDDFKIIVTQKGLIHLKISIQGKRAHGAYPWLGRNAIDIALDTLKEIREHKFKYKKNKYLRPPTLNIGTIRGGDKVNVVADWCEVELDLRFLPEMRSEDILKDLKNIVAKFTHKFKIQIEAIQEPYNIKETHTLVKYLKEAIRRFKVAAQIQGSEGATTITFLKKKNIPALATGFGSSGCCHIANEYVKIKNLYKGALVLEEFLKIYRF
jgi:succinyl-diaminopimelate desuccinylase